MKGSFSIPFSRRSMTRKHRTLLLLATLVLATVAAFFLMIAEPDRDRDRYSLIEEGLYMGSRAARPPPGTTAVLNLGQKKDAFEADHHSWAPIEDGPPAPDLRWLRRQVEFVDARRKAGDTVYVHCASGISRSGMVVVAYLMSKNGWTRDEALRFVRSKRPVTEPNPAFMERLLHWQDELRQEQHAKGQ